MSNANIIKSILGQQGSKKEFKSFRKRLKKGKENEAILKSIRTISKEETRRMLEIRRAHDAQGVIALGERGAKFVRISAGSKRPVAKWEAEAKKNAEYFAAHVKDGGTVGVFPASLNLICVDLDLAEDDRTVTTGSRQSVSDVLHELTNLADPVCVSQTPSGGRHVYYKNGGDPVGPVRWRDGDIRSEGGYAVLYEPSKLSTKIVEGGGTPLDPALVPGIQLPSKQQREEARVQNGERKVLPFRRPLKDPQNGAPQVLARVKSALACIDPDEYGDWVKIGMALYHGIGGGNDAFTLWDNWSSRSVKYNAGEITYKWETFARCEGAPTLGIGSIFALAKEAGWVDPRPAAESGTGEALSMEAFAQSFLSRAEGHFLHDGEVWWHFCEGRWAKNPQRAQEFMRQNIEKTMENYDIVNPKGAKAARGKWQSDKGVFGSLRLASSTSAIVIKPGDLDNNNALVGLPEGKVWDLEKGDHGEIREATLEDRLTKSLGVTPVKFEPKGEKGALEGTLWYKKMIEVLTPHYGGEAPKMVTLLLELIGSGLFVDHRFEAFPVLQGPPGGGKSILVVKFFKAIFGEYQASVSGENLAGRSKVHPQWKLVFERNRLVSTAELPQGGVFRSSILSEVVSGEEIVANAMRQNDRCFNAKSLILLACNEIPKGQGGLFRRIVPIHFARRVNEAEVDTALPQKLTESAPIVLQAARRAFLAARTAGHLTAVAKTVSDRRQYQETSDSVLAFAKEHYEEEAEKAEFIPTKVIHDHYKEWCEREGCKAVGARTLVQRFKEIFPTSEYGRSLIGSLDGKQMRGFFRLRKKV